MKVGMKKKGTINIANIWHKMEQGEVDIVVTADNFQHYHIENESRREQLRHILSFTSVTINWRHILISCLRCTL